MGHLLLGLLVLVCLIMSAAGGVDHFARKAYVKGCTDEAMIVVSAVASSNEEAAEQLKEVLFNDCEEKSKEAKLGDIL